jgi:hypothetical protein
VVPGAPDPLLQGRIELHRIAQDAEVARGTDGKLVDARKQLEELAVSHGDPFKHARRRRVRRGFGGAASSGTRRIEASASQPAAFQPIGPKCEIGERADIRDEHDRPEPRQGRRGPLLQQQKVGDERPCRKVDCKEKCRHGVCCRAGRSPSSPPRRAIALAVPLRLSSRSMTVRFVHYPRLRNSKSADGAFHSPLRAGVG